jgi:hypothetical protein
MADETQRKTGAGAEAAEGIHSADRSGRREELNTAREGEEVDRQADGDPAEDSGQASRRGSEPTTSHQTEHKSSYGGGGTNGGMK